jgi:hypothetical protein
MTPRTGWMVAAFALGLIANAALASWLAAQIHVWSPLKSLAFVSVTSNGSHAYTLRFGHGCVDLDFASFGPGGKIHSFHIDY